MSVSSGAVLRLVASMLWDDGELAQNVFNVVVSGGSSPYAEADLVTEGLAWLNVMYAALTSRVSDQLGGSESKLYIFDTVDVDWDELGTAAWAWQGTQVDEQLPRGVAAQVNARTTDPDVQGKKFIPGFTEAHNVDGAWGSTTLTSMLAWAASWVTPFVGATTGATWTPGIWSPTRGTFIPASGTVIAKAEPAYQRRRKRGVGA